ncbi:NAD(P)/FAD-dependent oxidoreductase [Saccharopolyspora erythraea]|uniref:Nitrite reductase (NAD(P)H) large subunit n=2 Tax=Saccharopolyspora erythraea TaxID=1836 RepID=A4FJF1_SACEN|nr:FAD-dependent oxidoreductase [Saccharopolyspora erythraea]QRK87980.1 NAD(P)/FAD-dependent oxidoreductase [Saccharopolyspora erythraea]CAM04176.1 nitrite reductase (NAD(P)H) large subunit [Saccharopolyspora erythraea NRRL 2338]
MSRTLVLVGHGMVGHRLVDNLSDGDGGDDWRIVILTEEPRPAYDRVSLSSYLDGKTLADLSLLSHDRCSGPAIELRLSTRVQSIDPHRRHVTTSDGAGFDYDVLVLATGSRPFVPPVPGNDLDGCFVYRTIDDLDRIREAAAGGGDGVVIGGGLLGLEAANALRLLGMRPHVIERAPWLMPTQLDRGGGQLLARLVGDLGLRVRTDVLLSSIDSTPDGRVRAVTLADGTEIETGLVVFAAGIRPRDELARRSGLAVGDRGGVLVDEHCRTSDENVWAIGECAAMLGTCYGLVAPGYAMADTVVQQLLGTGATTFPGADTSTKLKLLGVDVASFGDTSTGDGIEIVYANEASGTYAKFVFNRDARVLRGGILVGDAEPYSLLRTFVGAELPVAPEHLLLPAS